MDVLTLDFRGQPTPNGFTDKDAKIVPVYTLGHSDIGQQSRMLKRAKSRPVRQTALFAMPSEPKRQCLINELTAQAYGALNRYHLFQDMRCCCRV